jgi:hypothetical protein
MCVFICIYYHLDVFLVPNTGVKILTPKTQQGHHFPISTQVVAQLVASSWDWP